MGHDARVIRFSPNRDVVGSGVWQGVSQRSFSLYIVTIALVEHLKSFLCTAELPLEVIVQLFLVFSR